MTRVGAVIKAACCAFGISSCSATAVQYAEDASALVQGAVQAHQHQAASSQAGLGRAQLMEAVASGQMPSLPPFNCDEFPKLCQQPFNCQVFDIAKFFASMIANRGAAANGEAALGSWCTSPQYEDYISTCIVDKDLVKAAKIQYQWSVSGQGPEGVDEADASYCFIEGHCTNAAVTNDTTLEESYKMCDDRFGPSGWRNFGSLSSLTSVLSAAQSMPKDMHGGFHEPRHTQMFLKAACAMGNYHCDVMYCKETYCKIPYYVKKYGHLLPRAPGHLIQTREHLE